MHRCQTLHAIGVLGLAIGVAMAFTSPTQAQTYTYTYDDLGRLVASEIQSGSTLKHRVYYYDLAGNRLEASGGNGAANTAPSNSPPTANNDSYLLSGFPGIALLAPTPTSNDTDPDGHTLDIISTTTPMWFFSYYPAGTIHNIGGGNLVYDCPTYLYECDPSNFFLGDFIYFEYTVSDGHGGTDTTYVEIQLN